MDNFKVLIVDDSLMVRTAVRVALSGAGYQIVEAVDGEEGRQAIQESRDLSLVICDVNMPRMDGLRMLELVKADGANAELPVLMLSTEGDPSMIRRARDAGAAGWIVKPFQPAVVLGLIRRFVRDGAARSAK